MAFETITLDITDGVAVITMNRPDVMNGLSRLMRQELRDAVLQASDEARCVVLTGTGRAFCSGQDLTDANAGGPPNMEATLREEYEPLLNAIYDCPVPTISAVNGAAAGAGANLALAADVVIATESAQFLQAFTRIGLIPDAGGTYWLPRQVGFARAMGTMLFAEPVSAKQAVEWGMIWEAIPDAEFDAHWRARAATLAKGPTVAYRGVKQALRASFGNDLEGQLATEARLQGECGKTADFVEGVTAFLQKRSPKYKGA